METGGGVKLVIAGVSNDLLKQLTPVCSLREMMGSFWELLYSGVLNPPFNKLFANGLAAELFDEHISCGEDLEFNLRVLRKADPVSFIGPCGYHYTEPASGKVHSRRDVYSCTAYGESVRSLLADWLPEKEYMERWEKFFFRNVCGDIKTLACAHQPEAEKLIRAYVENGEVRKILRPEVWRDFPVKFRIAGEMLKYKRVKEFAAFARMFL